MNAKKLIYVFSVTILCAAGATAQQQQQQQKQKTRASETAPAAQSAVVAVPADFKDDGCSWFPDGDYLDCCVAHDRAYYAGGSRRERRRADKILYRCVAAKKGWHHKIIAPLMWTGVRIGGVSWLPTPFRWGFGRKKKIIPATISPLPKNASKRKCLPGNANECK